MAKGIHGRDFRPGVALSRFDPQLLVTILKASQDHRSDDIDMPAADENRDYVEVIQKIYVHRRSVTGGESGSPDNPTYLDRVEFITRPRIRVNVSKDCIGPLGSMPLGECPMGGGVLEGYRENGPQAEPGYFLQVPSGLRYTIIAVTPMPDKRTLISCSVNTTGGEQ